MKGTWWSSEWFGGALIVAFFSLTLRYDPLAGIEGGFYDVATTLSSPTTRDDGVVIVPVDELLQKGDGVHWPRDKAQQLLERINQGTPRAVVFFWPLEKSTDNQAMLALGQEAEGLLRQQPSNAAAPLLKRMTALVDVDQPLADAMRSVNRLILAPLPSLASPIEWRWSPRDVFTLRPPRINEPPDIAPLFATAAFAVASDTALGTTPGIVRRFPLQYRQADGTTAPTLPLQLLMLRQQIDSLSLRFTEAGGLLVGGNAIAADEGGYILPHWSRSGARIVTESNLMGNPGDKLHDRVVLAGPMSPAFTPLSKLPDGRAVAPVEMTALALTALASNEVIRIPPYARWMQLGALLMVALLLLGLLPRVSTTVALVTGLTVPALLINTQLWMLLLKGEWLPLATPAIALLAGVVLLMARRRMLRPVNRLHEQLGKVTLELAQQLRQQGQLDEAMHHLKQCPIGAACDELYQLGLDYERKRQFNKAEQVFAYLQHAKPHFKDAGERVRINREASERILIGGHPSSNPASTVVLNQATLQKPVVGRYQIERELGRGAMGLVYLGHDPKIGRTVAIKTVTLAHEYDEKQLEQVRERFFREAESAGRLSHPNIVTIYDVGEEGDLAYIAMDYLPGVSLAHHTSKENLLPVEEVMGIIMQVAGALEYAHENGVVHRDIKPANIIYDRDRGEATVTDFGVAHLADASKTHTGTILGSPYYMAPEQLAGARVDGRADLFSLGVTFYQLLTGAMPFEADSITALMYKIANSRHVSVSKLRSGIPTCASRIVNQLLQKDVEKRYQSGHELYKALQRCID